jgi:cell division protein ZapA (FtsZ GTPase activity inhibitor)
MERLVNFEVLGQKYPLYTDAPEEDIEEILQLVKMQIENNARASKSLLPANKVAVLTSLNMAGKYVRLKREFEEYKQQMADLIEKLTAEIENSLPPAGDSQMHEDKISEDGNKSVLAQKE